MASQMKGRDIELLAKSNGKSSILYNVIISSYIEFWDIFVPFAYFCSDTFKFNILCINKYIVSAILAKITMDYICQKNSLN